MGSHLVELDRILGQVPVMSLLARRLIPLPGAPSDRGAIPPPVDRIAGALVGAGIGSAIGLPYEWSRRAPRVRIETIPARLARTAYSADVQLLVRSVYAWLGHGLSSGPRLAELLLEGPPLRNQGRTTKTAVDRFRAGSPWFEAGVPSFGNGAAVRAVAFGLLLADSSDWRPIAVALDTVVTHANPTAVAVGIAVAETVALLARDGIPTSQPAVTLERLADRLPVQLRPAITDLSRRVAFTGPAPASQATAEAAFIAALYHLLTNPHDPSAAIVSAVESGGDTDTVAALTGAMVGAANGLAALPPDWVGSFSRTKMLLRAAERIAKQQAPVLPSIGHADKRDDDNGVHIHFLLDRSGSMASIADDVVGGFNTFLGNQREQTGRCRLTLAQFDSQDPFEVLRDGVDITAAPELDLSQFQPRGSTPLYDAFGSLLDHAESEALVEPRADRLVVVFTDGLENASRRLSRGDIFRRVSRLQEAGWTFVFLGANQDAYAEGGAIGFAAGSTSNFQADTPGTAHAWATLDERSSVWRSKDKERRRQDSRSFFEELAEAERNDR